MPKQQLFFLLLFHRSKLDPTKKGPNNRMEDQMSLSDDLLSQTHWRRFVTHSFTEPFHCFHVHIKTWYSIRWKIKWLYLMTYQAKLV